MKTRELKATAWTISVLSMAFALAAQADDSVEMVEYGYHTSYIPGGFDSNDNAQIVGEGIYPDTCYRPASPMVKTDPVTREVRVAPYAYHYNGICLKMLVPFDQTLDLGILPAGTFKIKQEQRGRDLEMGTIKVGVAASSDADDFLYAPVSQAYAETANGKTKIRVTGSFTDSCMKLTDLIASVEPKVLVVQPIAEREGRADCTSGNFPFDRTVELNGVSRGRYLLHVRSLNGKAFNHLVDL